MFESIKVNREKKARHCVRALWRVLPLFIVSAAWTDAAFGQGVSSDVPVELRRLYDSAFVDMYEDPGNLDKTFTFAGLAVRAGDFEGAVAALERMLVIEPNLPRVRLELGVLYFRLGSYQVAAAYFEELLADETLPEPIRARVRELVRAVEERVARHRLSGSLFVGVRYQSNANAGPATNEVRVGGVDAVLDDSFIEQADRDAFVSSQIRYVYDFATEPASMLEVDFSIYANEYAEQSSIATRFAELRLGPRYALSKDWLEWSELRPFLAFDYLILGGEESFSSFGAGVQGQVSVTNRWTFDGSGRVVSRRYNDSDSNPSQSDLDGFRTRFSVAARYEMSAITSVRAGLAASRDETRSGGQNNWEYGVNVSVQHSFEAFLGLTELPWLASFDLAGFTKKYDAPNPAVDPTVTRRDDVIRASILLNIPMNAMSSILISSGYSIVESNIPNYEYDNWSMSVGVIRQF